MSHHAQIVPDQVASFQIRLLEPHQVDAVKWLIVSVAEGIFHWQRSFAETLARLEGENYFDDVEQFQAHYFDRRGTFLVVLDQGRVVGSGAVRQVDERVCELRRLWLDESHQGKRIGFHLTQILFTFARQAGYTTMRLLTDQRQARAIQFYQRLGFHIIPASSDDPNDVNMEISLDRS